jgi:uncharacterized protein YaaQ
MKVTIAIVKDTDDAEVIHQLVSHKYRVTRMASTGGFLRRGNVTLLIGVEDEQVQNVIDIIDSACQPPEAGQHKATIFVVNSVLFEQT